MGGCAHLLRWWQIMNLLYEIYHLVKGDSLYILKRRGLKIGKNFYYGFGSIIDPDNCWHITIGDNVNFAPRVHVIAHDASTKLFLNYTKIGKVTIGNTVFIGASSIILPGVTIGHEVVIGAGSVVSCDIPSRSVAYGNPAKVISTIDDFITKKRSEMGIYPCFGNEYTRNGKVNSDKKREMNELMKDRFGYVV